MSNPLRISILYQSTPVPPNRGGRADVWRRIQAFAKLGASVQLIHWPFNDSSDATPEMLQGMDSVLADRVQINNANPLLPLPIVEAWRKPLRVRKFRIESEQISSVIHSVRSFNPDCYWIEGPWTYEALTQIRREVHRPYFYRSHNTEHRYMMSQARASKNFFDRWKIRLGCQFLRRYELNAMNGAAAVFDISVNDKLFWEQRGVECVEWLPPLAEAAFFASDPVERDIDVLFLGNLQSPNNVQGVEWLVTKVWPVVLEKRRDLVLHIMGSRPSEALEKLLQGQDCVSAKYNVSNPLDVYRRARVHVNPVMTGSGVQLKTVEMIMAGGAIVSTPQGFSGLPSEIAAGAYIAKDSEEFASLILRAVDERGPRNLVAGNQYFGMLAAERCLDAVRRKLKKAKG